MKERFNNWLDEPLTMRRNIVMTLKIYLIAYVIYVCYLGFVWARRKIDRFKKHKVKVNFE